MTSAPGFDGVVAGMAVAIPLAAGALILVTPRRLAEAWSYLAAAGAVTCVAMLLGPVLGGARPELQVLRLVPGLALTLRVDALGLTFGLLASGLWVITTVYSSGYARADHLKSRPRYFASFAASVGAAIGVAFAGNLLTFFLFYEALTLATYPLVVHKETEKAFAAGRRYLLFALGSGLALLTAIAWTWSLTGSLDFTPGGFLHAVESPGTRTALIVLFLLGVSVKSAVMPLHAWLPAAMVAPTPVSALLHAVAVVKAGVFGVMRVMAFVFGPASLEGLAAQQGLAAMAAATIVVGSLIAVRQDNLKRRLAYSTVVHLAYIVLGAALVAPLGLVGSMIHMVNHGLAKITLFFCAGAIYATTHLENVSDLRGLGRRMPWTFGAFAVASLGLVGVPGLSGFVGKFFLCRGAVEAGDMVALAIMLGASLFTAAYLLPIVQIAFFPGPLPPGVPERHAGVSEARPALVLPLLATAALVVVFGAVPIVIGVQYDLASAVSALVFGGAR
ncbi:MAG TPA: proton-conducting transporter membrane subunit [Vicinamibacterales bacterium]|nr:proton-conducting transporter membrane subunit [Vicinamibacterales bacterium]